MVKLLEQEVWVVKDAACAFFCGHCCWVDAFGFVFSIDKVLLLFGNLGQLVVEVVAVKEFLNGVSSEVGDVFFELGVVQIFPFFVDVLRVEVVFKWRDEGCFNFLVVQILPGEVPQPRVVFYFCSTVVAESVLRLSLNHSIDEVGSFNRPAARDFALLNLDLL